MFVSSWFQMIQGPDIRGQCLVSDDCEYMFSCNSQNQCVHDDIFGHSLLHIIGDILIVIIIGVSTVGGLGGGIEKVPILMVLMNYSQKTATVFTYPLMFGANFANFFMLIPQRHPDLDKPIIDYEIALILLPTTLLGSALGAIFNKMLPDILLMSIFILLMSGLVPGLITRAKEQRKRDIHGSMMREQQKKRNQSSINREETLLTRENLDWSGDITNCTVEQRQDYSEFEKEDKQKVPIKMFALIFLMFIFIQGTVILRGGRDQRSYIGIQYCSAYYWMWTGMIAILLGGLTFFNKWFVCRTQKKKIECMYFREELQLSYSWKNYLKIWGAGLSGGLMGGMLGVGSGSLMVPLLILFEVNSRVAAATVGFSKLFISAATVILAIVEGQLDLEELGFFIMLAIIGGLVLTVGIYYFVTKYRQQATVIFIVAGFLILNVISAVAFIAKEVTFDRWSKLIATYSYCV